VLFVRGGLAFRRVYHGPRNGTGIVTVKESDLWALLKRAIRAIEPDCLLERVENSVARGTPDVAYTIRGASGWIELKSLRPGSQVVGLRPTQVVWLRACSRAGGRGWVLARRGDAIRIWSGEDVSTLDEVGWRLCPRVEMNKPWRWAKLVEVLRGG
jgi:hypothetical protein